MNGPLPHGLRERLLNHLCVLALLAWVAAILLIPGPVAAQRRATIKVRTTPYLGYGPFFIAQAERYFADAGLDVEFIDMTAAAEAIPALVQGDFDVVSGAVSPGMLNAIARGARIQFVASQTVVTPGSCTSQAIVASRAFARSGALARPAALRGARVGSRQAFATARFLDKVLTSIGLAESDVQLVDAPDAIIGEVLRAERVDLALVGEPALSQIIASGAGVVWKTMEDALPGFELSMILYGRRLLDTDPDLGRRFMTAYLRGARQFAQGKTPRNMDILTEGTHLSREVLQRACWPSIRPDGILSGTSVMEFQEWLVQGRLLDRPLSLAQIYDRRFVDAANRGLAPRPR